VTAVSISGPTELNTGEVGIYQAATEPPTATLPIYFEWSNGDTGQTAEYSWAIPGVYTVEVTASNCFSAPPVSDTLTVTVVQTYYYTYLPIVAKNH
jgi:hypothetical protein